MREMIRKYRKGHQKRQKRVLGKVIEVLWRSYFVRGRQRRGSQNLKRRENGRKVESSFVMKEPGMEC